MMIAWLWLLLVPALVHGGASQPCAPPLTSREYQVALNLSMFAQPDSAGQLVAGNALFKAGLLKLRDFLTSAQTQSSFAPYSPVLLWDTLSLNSELEWFFDIVSESGPEPALNNDGKVVFKSRLADAKKDRWDLVAKFSSADPQLAYTPLNITKNKSLVTGSPKEKFELDLHAYALGIDGGVASKVMTNTAHSSSVTMVAWSSTSFPDRVDASAIFGLPLARALNMTGPVIIKRKYPPRSIDVATFDAVVADLLVKVSVELRSSTGAWNSSSIELSFKVKGTAPSPDVLFASQRLIAVIASSELGLLVLTEANNLGSFAETCSSSAATCGTQQQDVACSTQETFQRTVGVTAFISVSLGVALGCIVRPTLSFVRRKWQERHWQHGQQLRDGAEIESDEALQSVELPRHPIQAT